MFLLGVVFLIAAGNFLLAVLVWARARKKRTAVLFIALMLALAEWTFAYGILLLLPFSSRWKIVFANLQYLGAGTAPVFFFLFLLRFTGQKTSPGRRTALLLLVEPLIFNVLVWTDPFHHLYRTSITVMYRAGLEILSPTFGPVLWMNVLYAYSLEVLACAFLVRASLRSTTRRRPLNAILLVAALAPLVASIVNLLGWDPTLVDSVHYGFFVTGVCLFVSVTRYRIVPIAPERVTERALHAISDFILLSDPDGRIVWSNAAVTTILGYPIRRLRGTPYTDLLSLSAGEKLAPSRIAGESRAGQASDVEVECRHSVGRSVPVSLSITALRDVASEIEGFLLVGRDLSERRRLEEQRARMVRLESIRRLAGGVAHDFNNILTPVSAYAEYIAGKLAPGDQLGSYLKRIMTSVDRASRQADRLLLFSGQYSFETAPSDLDAMLRGAEPLLREAAAPASLRLELPGAGTTVAVDGTLFTWALDILVRHSAAGSSEGDLITVHAETGPVPPTEGTTGGGPSRRCARISITGARTLPELERDPGDPEPYQFNDDSIDTSSDLSVARRIVSLHGGTIAAAGDPTTIHVYLPME
jgi:PAS domain S-box-containing protein